MDKLNFHILSGYICRVVAGTLGLLCVLFFIKYAERVVTPAYFINSTTEAQVDVNVSGLSMYPAIVNGEKLNSDKLESITSPNRGDIVVLRHGLGKLFVKRAVATSGDTLVFSFDGVPRYLNGEAINYSLVGGQRLSAYLDGEKHYADHYAASWPNSPTRDVYIGYNRFTSFLKGKTSDDNVTITIPDGYFFALSDNLFMTEDSREFGLIPNNDVVYKVLTDD
jgi:signal peptidase I